MYRVFVYLKTNEQTHLPLWSAAELPSSAASCSLLCVLCFINRPASYDPDRLSPDAPEDHLAFRLVIHLLGK